MPGGQCALCAVCDGADPELSYAAADAGVQVKSNSGLQSSTCSPAALCLCCVCVVFVQQIQNEIYSLDPGGGGSN